MSRRWLLSLLCLSVLFVSWAQLTHAGGELSVNEARTRVVIQPNSVEVLLAVENTSGERLKTHVLLDVLRPNNASISTINEAQTISPGSQTLKFSLPVSIGELKTPDIQQLLWYRLRYRLSSDNAKTLSEGIVSLSEVTPEMFDVRVAASDLVRGGGRYSARVLASHPITRKPAANVVIDGKLTLEDDDHNSVELHASRRTGDDGYAVLEFVLPAQFPETSQTSQPVSGEIHVVGRRGVLSAEVEGEVTVDQFTTTLITTDKPIYQPGQVMHIRALLFTPARQALANRNISIKISDQEHTVVSRTVVTSTRFGVATADWTIPENARLGEYRVTVGVDGSDDNVDYGVRISRYDLPNFTVSIEPDRKYYLPGQNADVRVRADYLFGQPVRRGHVRVVRESEREWNYRDQKWDVVEGETLKGETDADGFFVAHIDLAEAHAKLSKESNDYYRDVTYAAYFTDPTTNRTEQRRFDLRLTKEPNHVYIIHDYNNSRTLPLSLYISTCYADGSVATTDVNLTVSSISTDPQRSERILLTKPLATLRTNRYGLAKLNGVRVPPELENAERLELKASVKDSNGRFGSTTDEITLDDHDAFYVATSKALYRPGEPITASIISSAPDETVTVNLLRDSTAIRSERVRLHNGRGSITFPYAPDFKDKLTVAAYTDFPETETMLRTRTVLYVSGSELKVSARPSRSTYRPGQDAHVSLNVRGAEGRGAESALGVVVSDKAVDERFRTEQEFSGRYSRSDNAIKQFLGLDEQIAGLTLRDLRRLDAGKYISSELDLVAEVLLNQNTGYSPRFFSDEWYLRASEIFKVPIKKELEPVKTALDKRYDLTGEYPKTAGSVQSFLAEAGIDFSKILDPWGTPYRPAFSVEYQFDVLKLMSAGPDKRFDTSDDFDGERVARPYFQLLGKDLDKTVRRYHEETGGFIRDLATLRQQWALNGIALDELHDPWGKPYRFVFDVNETDYVIKVVSSGPDKEFSTEQRYSSDDFELWTARADYFAEPRARIAAILDQGFKGTNKFPQTKEELRAILRNTRDSLDTLRDPWGHPYYASFNVRAFNFDLARIENSGGVGEAPTQRIILTPITQQLAFVNLRSAGADGNEGTSDDFSIATFTAILSQQSRTDSAPQPVNPRFVLSSGKGALSGVVTDELGAVIPRATVVATGSAENQRYETSTDDDGKYFIGDLPLGMYEVRFEAPGFMAYVFTSVVVRVANITLVNAVLRAGQVTELVQVTAAASAVNLATQVSETVTSSRLSRGTQIVTKSGASLISTPRLREYFPETLVWQPSIETGTDGRAKIDFKLADNITTWKVAVVGSTLDGQIGTTETEIKAFQPFFVDHDPPRVLTEGDEISLPAVVRNYLNEAQLVNLQVKPESWFSLLGPARRRTQVPAGDSTRKTFDIRAVNSVKDGKLRITALAGDGNDAIEKPVTVHPDGEELTVTDSDLVGSSAKLELNVPDNMIPNSSHAELKFYPNLTAHVIESIEAIMSRPYGCGEQTISSTYPSLLLLRNYKKTGQDFPLRDRAQRYLNIGYNRLLNYRDENGAFTYWGHGDANVALTAYALRFLTDASDVISVDDDVVSKAQQWLLKKQREDGSWQSESFNSAETARRSALLTAYVTRVLASIPGKESKDKRDVLQHALNYLGRRAAEIDEPYLLASYALAAVDLGDVARAKPVIEKLRSMVIAEGSTSYWALETNTPFYGWGIAGRVETTALVMQALTRYCDSQRCDGDAKLVNSALLFLLKNKDRYGVWYSTQATINVLDSMLSLLSGRAQRENSDAAATITVNGRLVQTVQIPVTNRLVGPMTIDISPFVGSGSNVIEIKRAARSPYASAQAVVAYYIPWTRSATASRSGDLRLRVAFDKTAGKTGDEISCHVEAERVGFAGYGMMLAEIGLPPGADVDRSTLEETMKRSGWAIGQYDVLPDRVVFYLWPRAGGVNFDFKFRPRFGLNAKTAASNVYDYYNPESHAVVPPAKFTIKD